VTEPPRETAPSVLTLREVLARLWRRRVSLVVFPLVVGALTVALSLLLPDTYRPQAIVSIELPRRREGQPLVPLDTLVQNYRALVQSANLQEPVITALQASEGVVFSPEQFSARVTVSVPRESQFLFIGFRSEKPALATRVANSLAQALTDQVNVFNRAEVTRFLERYHTDIGRTRQEVEEAGERLAAFERDAQIDLLAEEIKVAAERRSALETQLLETELQISLQSNDPIERTLAEAEDSKLALQRETEIEALRSRREALLEERSTFETDRAVTRVDLAAQRESLGSLQEDLAQQPQVIDLRRTIDTEPALQQAAAAAAHVDLSSLLGLTLSSEALNPIHNSLATDAATQRAKVAELERREQEVTDRIAQLDDEISQVSQAIYDGELALERRQRAVDLADTEYRALFETSPAGLSTRRAQLTSGITALRASIEAMRTRHAEFTAREMYLQAERDIAYKSLDAYSAELSTATLSVLEQMPTLALVSPAPLSTVPEPKHRGMVVLGGLLVGLAAALGRVYLLDF
jgi:capsular polysaccharide biosynthesis protein